MRELFEAFNGDSAKARILSEYLALDKTLYPYRGRTKITQYAEVESRTQP